MLLLIALCVLSIFSSKVTAVNVTYISQTRDLTPYWHNTYAVAKAAAKDLNITLTIIEGQGHHLYQAEVIEKLTLSSKKPDLLIFHAYKQNAQDYFKLLEQAQIPFVTYSNFSKNPALPAHKPVGLPQENFKYWLSEHYVENTQGAALLAKSLIQQSRATKSSNDEIKVLALSGDLIAESLERSEGVALQIEQEKNTILMQDIVANWYAKDAQSKFKALYSRHDGIDVVWASSDTMAIGALAGAIELGLTPNKDIFIGGFDWDKEAINKVKSGQLAASAGGQFYNIAWLLVQVYDHFNNQVPFSSKTAKVADKYAVIDQDNLKELEPLTTLKSLSTINFYCFTQSHTLQGEYDFSVNALLKQTKNTSKEKCN